MQDLSYLGIRNVGRIHHNLSTPALNEQAIRSADMWFSHQGTLQVRMVRYMGRSGALFHHQESVPALPR